MRNRWLSFRWMLLGLGMVPGLGLGPAKSAAGDTPVASSVAPAANPGWPTLETIRDRIIARAAHEAERREKFQAAYAYRVRKVTERRDAANRLRSREVREETHDPRTPSRPEKDDAPGYRRKDFTVDRRLFRRFQMTLAGETVLRGRPAWMLDFAPVQPPEPARGLKERFLNRIAGRVWIDQEDAALARLELHLTAPLPVIGGLVGAVKGCRVVVQRRRTEDGLWYNERLRWHLEGRRLFTTKVMIHEEQHHDVRKVAPIELSKTPVEKDSLSR